MSVEIKIKRASVNIVIVALLFLPYLSSFSQPFPVFKEAGINPDILKQTFTYAVKGADTLQLDVYSKVSEVNGKKPCIIFVFGGGFVIGERNDSIYNTYFNAAVEHGYTMISISYRLGLKGVTNVSVFNSKPLKNAVDMAVDDLYDATNWVIENRQKLGIDTAAIILSGSSAGAITIQTAEFERCNLLRTSSKLPNGFSYASTIAFSGAILSYSGCPRYKEAPAPTLMFHGTADKIVPYKRIKFFKKGLFGASAMAATFKKNNYPYYICREEGLGHEVSVLPMIENLPVIFDFLETFVVNKKPYQMDMTIKDLNARPMVTMDAKTMFQKLSHAKSQDVIHSLEETTQ